MKPNESVKSCEEKGVVQIEMHDMNLNSPNQYKISKRYL